MRKSLHESLEKISSSADALGLDTGNLFKVNPADFAVPGVALELEKLAAEAAPPSSNTGANPIVTPHFFPHGEKKGVKVVQRTKLDWLAFTSSADFENLCRLVSTLILPGVEFLKQKKGAFGYPESHCIVRDGVQYGLMCTGAEHGRHYVSLTGVAAKTFDNDLVECIHEAFTMPALRRGPQGEVLLDEHGKPLTEFDVRLSRVDICLDVFDTHTWDHAFRAYHLGRFKNVRGGKNPQLTVIDVSSDGVNKGRTMQVGVRGGRVLGRVYEKGLEVFAHMPEELRIASDAREAELGLEPVHADNWLRLEAEFRHEKDQRLPFEILLQRDQYFAGSYPYFADVLGETMTARPVRLKSDIEVDLLALMHNAKRSYGTLIYSLGQLGFSASEVVEHLSSDRNNDKLVRSGLLAAIKDILRAEDPDFDIPLF